MTGSREEKAVGSRKLIGSLGVLSLVSRISILYRIANKLQEQQCIGLARCRYR